jgi:hypothetical protein
MQLLIMIQAFILRKYHRIEHIQSCISIMNKSQNEMVKIEDNNKENELLMDIL